MSKTPADGRPELELGQRVLFTHKAVPVFKDVSTRSYNRQRFMGRTLAAKSSLPIQGVFIGWRNAQEGVVRYANADDGPAFKMTDRPLVALVVYDPRRSPIMVHPEDLTPMASIAELVHNAKRDAVAEVGAMIEDKVRMGDNSSCEAAAGENAVAEFLKKHGEWNQ